MSNYRKPAELDVRALPFSMVARSYAPVQHGAKALAHLDCINLRFELRTSFAHNPLVQRRWLV